MRTPIPWEVSVARDAQGFRVIAIEGAPELVGTTKFVPVVCHMVYNDSEGGAGSNADLIVRAVNTHDNVSKLVARLTALAENNMADAHGDQTEYRRGKAHGYESAADLLQEILEAP